MPLEIYFEGTLQNKFDDDRLLTLTQLSKTTGISRQDILEAADLGGVEIIEEQAPHHDFPSIRSIRVSDIPFLIKGFSEKWYSYPWAEKVDYSADNFEACPPGRRTIVYQAPPKNK